MPRASSDDGSSSAAAHASGSSHRECLRNRDWVVGTVVSSPDPVLAEWLARSFDFLWIDLEHSALSIRDVQTLVIAVQGAGAHALVRLPRSDSELLSAVLDCGPDGVVAPKVRSTQEVRSFVRALTYAPDGERGFAPRRASGGTAAAAVLKRPPVACVVQIETVEAIDEIEDIAACDGVDAFVVGTADLSLELGEPLNLEAPALISATGRVGAAAARRGVAWGVAAGSLAQWVRSSPSDGATVLTFSSDARIYASAVDDCARALRPLSQASAVGQREIGE